MIAVEGEHVEAGQGGDGECSPLDLLQGQLASASPSDQILALPGDPDDPLAVGLATAGTIRPSSVAAARPMFTWGLI